MTRRLILGAVLAVAGALPLAATPASAAGPTSLTIDGRGLAARINVRADADPELFAAVLGQVSWLTNRSGQTAKLPTAKLGVKYTMVVYVKDAPAQVYDLYPMAAGGPRVFRPADQPDLRKVTAAWFFGRLNMSETLRIAGVPLPARPDALSAGIGSGGADRAPAEVFNPFEEVAGVFGQWRQLYLLNGAILLAIAAGLAGFSLLIRRKV